MDVIAAPAKVIVGVPSEIREQNCELGLWFFGSNHPRKREELPRFTVQMEVVKSGAFRSRDELFVVWAGVAELILLYSSLGIVLIRSDLHGRSGSVFIEPPDGTH